MKGVVRIWPKLTMILVVWATGSFALSQGVSWDVFKPLGKGSEAVICHSALLVSGVLSVATFLLAASYARSAKERGWSARVPPIADDLDESAGYGTFSAIQATVLLLTVCWPIYCQAHFILKTTTVPLHPCTRPATNGCAPDHDVTVSQWRVEFPPRVYRYGVDDHSEGVAFVAFFELLLSAGLELGVLVAVGALASSLFSKQAQARARSPRAHAS